jgi:hypothetical protein
LFIQKFKRVYHTIIFYLDLQIQGHNSRTEKLVKTQIKFGLPFMIPV